MKKYFICPDLNLIEIKSCFQKCRLNNRCCPLTYLKAASRDREWIGKPSVTQCISGTREAFLKIKNEYSISPKKQAFAIVGTRGHSLLEEQGHYSEIDAIIEKTMEFDGITGTPDTLEKQNNGENWLIDYKVSGAFKISKALGMVSTNVPVFDNLGNPVYYKSGKNKGKQKVEKEWVVNPDKQDCLDWKLQLNFYRLMFESIGEKVDRIKIFGIVRDFNTRTSKQYGLKEPVYYIDVPVMQKEQIIDFFKFKKEQLLSFIDSNIIPPMCTDEENWYGRKCKDYCEVSEFCALENDNPYLYQEEDRELWEDPF